MTTTLTEPRQSQSTAVDLHAANQKLADADAAAVIRWADQQFGDGLIMTTSFGAQSAVMLHLVTRLLPHIPVVWIDTGYLFPETYQFADDLTRRLDLNLKIVHPQLSPAHMEARHGKLWEQGVEGLNQYDWMRKVEPLQKATRDLGARGWLSGVRGKQTSERASMHVVGQFDARYGAYPVHPILSWTTKDVHEYLKAHDLPYHPLYEQGYASIGDTHSTRPVTAGEDERAGRFRGLKSECGLHIPQSQEESESRDSSGL